MFGFVAKITKARLFTAVSAMLVIVLILSALYVQRSNSASAEASTSAQTTAQRIKYLSAFGWQASEDSETQKDTVIPAEFDNIYDAYNKIQLNQGFDLTKFKGKTLKLYSYKIDNYPKDSESVYATMLVSDGIIVGGDVHSTELNGFMHGFKMP